jgi:hypothetical protein
MATRSATPAIRAAGGLFRPGAMDDLALAAALLPPRPDASLPLANANWKRGIAGIRFTGKFGAGTGFSGLCWKEQAHGPGDPGRIRRTPPTRTPVAGHAFPVATAAARSLNWSGAYVRPRAPVGREARMALVQGFWRMPKTPPPTDRFRVWSAWVGLDGHDPASTLMPQIGVAWLGGPADRRRGNCGEAVVWAQWWDEFNPAGLHRRIEGVPVRSGDLLYAQVMATGGASASFLLSNLTQKRGFACHWAAPARLPNGRPRPRAPRIEGRTAEWIVERPLIPDIAGALNATLGDFGVAEFSSCNAAAQVNGAWREFQLQHARAIRMVTWDNTDVPGRIVSFPAIDRAAAALAVRHVAG